MIPGGHCERIEKSHRAEWANLRKKSQGRILKYIWVDHRGLFSLRTTEPQSKGV